MRILKVTEKWLQTHLEHRTERKSESVFNLCCFIKSCVSTGQTAGGRNRIFFINCRCPVHKKFPWSCTSSKDFSVLASLLRVLDCTDGGNLRCRKSLSVTLDHCWAPKIRKARRGTKMQNFNSNGNVLY